MRTRRRYPVVAMRAQVVLPGGVARFDLSRSRTVAAVEEAMVRDGLIFLVAQKNPEALDPGVSGTYRYGTLCQIRSLTRTSRDTRRAMLFGIRRCSVEQLVLEGDIYEAELYNAPLREIEKDSKEKEAICSSTRGRTRPLRRSTCRGSSRRPDSCSFSGTALRSSPGPGARGSACSSAIRAMSFTRF